MPISDEVLELFEKNLVFRKKIVKLLRHDVVDAVIPQILEIKNLATKEDIHSILERMATKEDLEAVKEDLKSLESDLKSVESRMATKEDLKNMATKEELESIKEDMKNMATKEDIKNMATKDELKDIKEELKNIATKDELKDIKEELKNMATKEDLIEAKKELNKNINKIISKLGSRWGIETESSIRNLLKGLIEKEGWAFVEKWNYKDVELDIVIHNGTYIVVEIKSRVYTADVEKFESAISIYEEKKGIKVERKIMMSPLFAPNAVRKADKDGIEVYSLKDWVLKDDEE